MCGDKSVSTKILVFAGYTAYGEGIVSMAAVKNVRMFSAVGSVTFKESAKYVICFSVFYFVGSYNMKLFLLITLKNRIERI